MSSNKSHRNRGGSGWVANCTPTVRKLFRKQTIYGALRGIEVLTPDGCGIIRGDSNRLGGSRKFIIQLTNGTIRRYSLNEVADPTGNFHRMISEEWDKRWL